MRRFFSSFLACLLLVSSFVLPFSARAVLPIAFYQSALLSFCASAGLNFSGGSDFGQLISGLGSLFDDWAANNGNPSLSSLSDGITYDTLGHFVLSSFVSSLFYDFSEGIVHDHSMDVGSSATVGGSAQLYTPGGNLVVPCKWVSTDANARAYFGPAAEIIYNGAAYPLWICLDNAQNSQEGVIIYCSIVPEDPGSTASQKFARIWCAANVSHYYEFQIGGYGLTYGPYSLDSQFRNKVNLTLSTSGTSFSSLSSFDRNTVYISDLVQSGSGGFTAKLREALSDLGERVAAAQSMIIDVGAEEGSNALDIIDAVSVGAAAADFAPTASVMATEIIDTPVQPYPDIDSLGLPELGLALTSRFPFSIPWDISAIYSALSHESIPPVKSFQLIPSSVLARWGINADTTITIDLTDSKYSVLLAIIHWSSIIGFCFALAVMTKRYVWTTGG